MARRITVSIIFVIIATAVSTLVPLTKVWKAKKRIMYSGATAGMMKFYLHIPFVDGLVVSKCPIESYYNELDVHDFPHIVEKSLSYYYDYCKSDCRLADYEVRYDNQECIDCILIRNYGKDGKYDTDFYRFDKKNVYDDILILNKHVIYKPDQISDEMETWIKWIQFFMTDGNLSSGYFMETHYCKEMNEYFPIFPSSIRLEDYIEVNDTSCQYDSALKRIKEDDLLDCWGRKMMILLDPECSNNIVIVSKGYNGRIDNDGFYSPSDWKTTREGISKWLWGSYHALKYPLMDDIVLYNGVIYCGPYGISDYVWHWSLTPEFVRKKKTLEMKTKIAMELLDKAIESVQSNQPDKATLLLNQIQAMNISGFPVSIQEVQNIVKSIKSKTTSILIPRGTFIMGRTSHAGDDKGFKEILPRHEVQVDFFYIDKYEVTVEEYKTFCSETGYIFREQPSWNKEDHPILNVSWYDAEAYCEWVGKRLPSEAEWEYAARSGKRGCNLPWGNQFSSDYANSSENEGKDRWAQSSPKWAFPPNSYGLHDMIGNAWEWVEDCWHESYDNAPDDGTAWTSGICEKRVLRGGSWDHAYGECKPKIDSSTANSPYFWSHAIGFRCAKSANDVTTD